MTSIILKNQKVYLNLTMYFFRKKDPNRPTNINLKIMHFINALAIAVFVAGIIFKLIQWLTKS
ncbi:DUF6728 family protein [Pedobacter sp. UYEF25]